MDYGLCMDSTPGHHLAFFSCLSLQDILNGAYASLVVDSGSEVVGIPCVQGQSPP
jgi:hypothetical protein